MFAVIFIDSKREIMCAFVAALKSDTLTCEQAQSPIVYSAVRL